MRDQTVPYLWIGLFFGILVGVCVTLIATDRDTSESYEAYRQRRMAEAGIRPNPAPRQPRVESTRPGVRPEQPREGGAPAGMTAGGNDRAKQSIAKVHFMKKFLAALTSRPANMAPKPGYVPLLKDPSKPLSCVDCHDSGTIDFEGMRRLDPGEKAVDSLRHSPMFMRGLMEKWVERLNRRHGARLTKRVSCTDCHAFDPRDDETRTRVYPALMHSFVQALVEKPRNQQPSSRWKPLLKDPGNAVSCSTCHKTTGKVLEKNLAAGRFNLAKPEPYASNREFMIDIMEKWVHELNADARDQLVKTVGCKDCHEVDPRN